MQVPGFPVRTPNESSHPRIPLQTILTLVNLPTSGISFSHHVWTRPRRQVQQSEAWRYVLSFALPVSHVTHKSPGGKHFSRDLQPLDKDGKPLGMWRDPEDHKDSDEESTEEESSSDDSGDEGPAAPQGDQDLSREQRREQQRLKKQAAIAKKNKKVAEVGDLPTDSEEEETESDEDMPANPNHTQKARNQARAVTGPSGEAPPKKPDENLSRREREALAAQQAKERYQKLHAEGKTDEARADLARLKLIREQREAAAAKKQAEKDEKDSQAAENKERLDREAKKRAAALGTGTRGGKKPTKK